MVNRCHSISMNIATVDILIKLDLDIFKLPLQAECVRKRQYGYVESAALLAASGERQLFGNKV